MENLKSDLIFCFEKEPTPSEIYESLKFDPACSISPQAKELIIERCLDANYWVSVSRYDFELLSEGSSLIDAGIVECESFEIKSKTEYLFHSLKERHPQYKVKSVIICLFLDPDSYSSINALTEMLKAELTEDKIWGMIADPQLSPLNYQIAIFVSFVTL